MRLSSVCIFVENMETMVRFYRDVMRLNIEWDGGVFTGVRTEDGIYFSLCDRKHFESQLLEPLDYPKGLNGTMDDGNGQDE